MAAKLYVSMSIGLEMNSEPDLTDPMVRAAMFQVFLGKMVTYPEKVYTQFFRSLKDGGEPEVQAEVAPKAEPSTALEREVASFLESLSPEVEE